MMKIKYATRDYLLKIRKHTVRRIYVALLGQLSSLVTIGAIQKETLEEIDFVLRCNVEELQEDAIPLKKEALESTNIKGDNDE